MAPLTYRIVNVFTHQGAKLSGNPLCVFEDAAALDSATMQALARQFNLSETTFILPSERADARVRIFTPSYEMPFAGHPTLGSAHVCRSLGLGGDALRLEIRAGVISVKADGNRWRLTAQPAAWREVDAPLELLAQMLSLDPNDLAERPMWVKAGKEQLIIPLTSEAAVRRVQPNPQLCSQVVSEDGHSMAYVFAELGDGRVLSRFFFPVGGAMLEDPATGSATANLGGWLLAMGRALPCSWTISQGEYVSRPSTLQLKVDATGQIRVGGEVIEIARGVLTL